MHRAIANKKCVNLNFKIIANLCKTTALLLLCQSNSSPYHFSSYLAIKEGVKLYTSDVYMFFQNPLCQPTTAPPSGQTTTSKASTTSAKPASTKPTVAPTKPSSNVTLVVNGQVNSVTLTKLKHFSDYTITVSSIQSFFRLILYDCIWVWCVIHLVTAALKIMQTERFTGIVQWTWLLFSSSNMNPGLRQCIFKTFLTLAFILAFICQLKERWPNG